ncbi:MAG: Putative polysaccharide biosynthesis protein [Microgenomates bacterium 39_7]|nr:MAG: Putative polysaccharide biosynthesis protein [Microgenomates bacterium 39_7]
MSSVHSTPSILNHYPLKSKGLQQSLINVLGSAIASGFAAISLILLSRFLGPTYFGQFSTAFALTLILVRLNDLGLSVATSKLVPSTEDENKKVLLALLGRYRLALSGLIVVAGLIFSQILPSFLLQDNPMLILLAFLVTFATALFEHAQFTLQATHRFSHAALLNAAQGFIKLIFVLPFIFLIIQNTVPMASLTIGIFVFYMLSPALPVILNLLIKPNSLPISISVPTNKEFPALKQLKKRVFALTKHAGLGILAAGIIENVDILFVQGYLSDFDAGLLGGVNRIALLLYIVGYAVGNVLNPRVAKYKKLTDLYSFWKKSWMIFALCVVGFIFSMFIAEPLIVYTIGSSYLEALGTLKILLAAGFVTIALMPFIAFFYSFNLSWYFSLSGVIQLIIVIFGNIWLVPLYGIEAAAWVRLVARGALFLMTFALARWQLDKLAQQEATPVKVNESSSRLQEK